MKSFQLPRSHRQVTWGMVTTSSPNVVHIIGGGMVWQVGGPKGHGAEVMINIAIASMHAILYIDILSPTSVLPPMHMLQCVIVTPVQTHAHVGPIYMHSPALQRLLRADNPVNCTPG